MHKSYTSILLMILSVTRFRSIQTGPNNAICLFESTSIKSTQKKLIQQIERDYIIIDNIYIDDAYEDEVHRML